MWRCAEKSLPEWPFDDNDADKSISEDTMAGWWAELLPRVSLAGRTNQPWSVKMTRMNFGNSFAGPQMCHFGQIGAKKESNSQHKEILRYLTFRASLPCRQILLQRHFHCFRTHAAQGSTMQYSASDDENLLQRNIWQWCGEISSSRHNGALMRAQIITSSTSNATTGWWHLKRKKKHSTFDQ